MHRKMLKCPGSLLETVQCNDAYKTFEKKNYSFLSNTLDAGINLWFFVENHVSHIYFSKLILFSLQIKQTPHWYKVHAVSDRFNNWSHFFGGNTSDWMAATRLTPHAPLALSNLPRGMSHDGRHNNGGHTARWEFTPGRVLPVTR